ncbi:MAG: addiction module antidote protein, HigA family, partial [Desulfobacteraceae bacterium]
MIKSFKHKGLAELFEKGSSRKIRPDLHLKRPPVHPGEILREDVLKHLGLSVSEASKRLGISRQQLHRVLACTHPITTEMALRIGKFAGNGPGLWLRMQQAYDLWHVEHRMSDELSKIKSIS